MNQNPYRTPGYTRTYSPQPKPGMGTGALVALCIALPVGALVLLLLVLVPFLNGMHQGFTENEHRRVVPASAGR